MIGLDGVTRWICGGGMPRRDGDRLIVEGIVRDATAEVHGRAAAAGGRAHRRADRDLQPPPLLRGARGRARALAPRAAARPGCCWSTSTTSRLVNDTYGHQVGDAVLIEIATRLPTRVRTLRHRRALGRRGVHRARAGARRRARALARSARGCARASRSCRSRSATRRLDVTVSVGACSPIRASSHELLVDQADRALYAAKRLGRDRARLFSELTAHDLAAEEPEAIRLAQALSLSAGVREGVPERHAEQVAELAARSVARSACRRRHAALPPRRLAARHRQGRDPRPHPRQARRARRARSGGSCARTPRSASSSSAASSARRAWPRSPCAITTSASTAAAIPTGSTATRSRSRRASSPSPTPTARSRPIASIPAVERPREALGELRLNAGRHHDRQVVEALEEALEIRHRDISRRLRSKAA